MFISMYVSLQRVTIVVTFVIIFVITFVTIFKTINITMAIPIKSVPTLRGKVAETFVRNAEKAAKERATIDVSKQAKMCASILSKAKI